MKSKERKKERKKEKTERRNKGTKDQCSPYATLSLYLSISLSLSIALSLSSFRYILFETDIGDAYLGGIGLLARATIGAKLRGLRGQRRELRVERGCDDH